MGYRFQGGNPLSFIDRKPPFGAGSDPSNITDACYPYGSIQVPGELNQLFFIVTRFQVVDISCSEL